MICYDDLTEDIPDIYVYSSDYLNNTKNWCKNLNIKIGIADADKFKSPNKQPGLIVKVFDNNTGKPIQENQLIDLDRELKVVFTTEDGYVFGKSNISSYTEILKYSDYLKKINSLMKTHSAKKICKINLDNTEPISYAIYYLDDKEVSNWASAYEGQKLKIEYKIIDKNYEIKNKPGNIWSYFNNKEIIECVNISVDMDGETITRETFGIEVEKR